MMRLKMCCLALMLTASATALAQQETLIVKADGTHVIIRTDESGTTVNDAKTGFTAEPLSPHEEGHWNGVYALTKAGGRIIAHRLEQGAQ